MCLITLLSHVQVSLDDDSCYCSNSRLGVSESGQMSYYTGSYLASEDGAFYCQHCHRDYDIYDTDEAGEVTASLCSGAGQSTALGTSTEDTSAGTLPCCCPYCGHEAKVTNATCIRTYIVSYYWCMMYIDPYTHFMQCV